jgi:hypothetical protein
VSGRKAITVESMFLKHNLQVRCCRNCASHFRYGRGSYRCGRIDSRQSIKQYYVCDLWSPEDESAKQNETGQELLEEGTP